MGTFIKRITITPEICNRKPTIRGLRITIATILKYLAIRETIEKILEAYTVLEEDDIKACLEFAKSVTF